MEGRRGGGFDGEVGEWFCRRGWREVFFRSDEGDLIR